ncbi:MAG: ABC transporter ATP-binding protein [Thaumarchaeota archaeon]|nr:ABC transporter ATP-binding protein [Nitrososphaerota archaeon]
MVDEPMAIQLLDLRKTYKVFRNLREGSGATVSFVNFFRILFGLGGQRTVALDSVSFSVKKGEVFGLLGPNGAGKTTMLKILSTLVLPDSGKAYVEGIDVTRRPRETVKRLQSVFAESQGFERRLTGRENLEFFATLLGLPKKQAKARIDELLTFTGMTDRADVMFQRYSTGMARRLLVCRALLSNASVLLFDEPTAALDPIAAADFRKLIRHDLADKEGKTILLATHNLWEAEQICDRIAVVRKGRILAVGTPEEIKKNVSDRVNLSLIVLNYSPQAAKTVTEAILAVRGVLGIEILEDRDHEGSTRLNIEGVKGLNYNVIFQKLSSLNLEVTSLESSQPSLEDAFLKLNLEAAA